MCAETSVSPAAQAVAWTRPTKVVDVPVLFVATDAWRNHRDARVACQLVAILAGCAGVLFSRLGAGFAAQITECVIEFVDVASRGLEIAENDAEFAVALLMEVYLGSVAHVSMIQSYSLNIGRIFDVDDIDVNLFIGRRHQEVDSVRNMEDELWIAGSNCVLPVCRLDIDLYKVGNVSSTSCKYVLSARYCRIVSHRPEGVVRVEHRRQDADDVCFRSGFPHLHIAAVYG